MKTKYRYIHFEADGGTDWRCINSKSDETIGSVMIFERWHQWCFYPCADTVYNSECLDDIAAFLRQLNGGDVGKRE